MIDKVVILNDCEMHIVYTNRSPVRIYNSCGDIVSTYLWLFSNTDAKVYEFKRRLESANEETGEIAA